MVNQVAYSNVTAGKFSSTGERYSQLISVTTATSLQSPTSMESSEQNAGDAQLTVFATGLIVAAAAFIVIFFAALWLRKPKSELS